MVVARHVAGTDTKIAEGTMADVIMMIDAALTRLLLLRSLKSTILSLRSFVESRINNLKRMITNKNVMMIVAIVVVMTIADTVAMIVRVAMKIVAAVVMMVHDHTHDLITNTMIVEDTNKSETIEDKKIIHMSILGPWTGRTGLDCHWNNRIDVRKNISD